MTSPLIPTKDSLLKTQYTPAELIADQGLETWLFGDASTRVSRIGFIVSLMTAYRAGASTVTYQFNSYADAQAMAAYIDSSTDYGYTVTGPVSGAKTITVSWS